MFWCFGGYTAKESIVIWHNLKVKKNGCQKHLKKPSVIVENTKTQKHKNTYFPRFNLKIAAISSFRKLWKILDRLRASKHSSMEQIKTPAHSV